MHDMTLGPLGSMIKLNINNSSTSFKDTEAEFVYARILILQHQ
jgi:hypothetical protein